jgi:tRNA pseudouridine55 synthase
MNGFLNIDKPTGMTSADVVRVLKRALNVKKIGYIGTLDPIATGVLPVGLGLATRLFPYLERQDKTYDATMILGAATDTQDRTGKVIAEGDPSVVTEEMVVEALRSMVGQIEQIPPMFSAKKIDGKRLYDLAREGIEVERKPVTTTIHKLDFLSKEGNTVRFTVTVSTGAYVRTLCHDVGAKLGCQAHLGDLVRLANGPFVIEHSVPLSVIEAGGAEAGEAKLISLADGPSNLAKAVVVAHAVKRLTNGQNVGVSEVVDFEDRLDTNLVRLVTREGKLLAIAEKFGVPIAGFPFSTLNPKRVLI